MPSLSAVIILRRLLHRDGLLRPSSTTVHNFRFLDFCHSHYSTAPAEATAADDTHFMARYLMSSSLGFSRDEAVAAARKLNRVRTTKTLDNPDLVVNFFQECGLYETQIKQIAAKYPSWLLADVEQVLKPKMKVLLDLGFPEHSLVKVILRSAVFNLSLDRIVPSINFLKSNFGSDVALKAIKKSGRIISFPTERMASSLAFLLNSGFPHERIQKCVCREPGVLGRKLDVLQKMVRTTELDLGIPRTSPMFLLIAQTFLRLSKSTLERKLETFRSFGLSDSDIKMLFQRQPTALLASETVIKEKFDFFVNDLGFKPTYVASRPSLIGLSLEKRLLPRSEVFKVLKENNLIKIPVEGPFYTMMSMKQLHFYARFVCPYRDKWPAMHNRYLGMVTG